MKADVLANIHNQIKETAKHTEEKEVLTPKQRINRHLFIRTKTKEVTNLKFNPIQAVYWEDKTQRDIILKPRQLGFSTLILAEFFDDTINNPNTTTVIIAHDADSTRKLFDAVQFMYNNLPEQKKKDLNDGRSKPKYGNRKEYYFESINSRIYVGTAGSTDFGRGSTINNLHCSEVAFWPDPETLMTGLLQAVPRDGRVVLETTANGVGNYFYRTYQEAKAGEVQWEPHFYRWFDHPDYQLPLDKGEKLSPTKEEQLTVDQYNLTPEQLKWRRWKISEMPEKDGLSKEERFLQEYPEDDTSCFLSSGRPVFDMTKLKVLLEKVQNNPYGVYEIDYETKNVYETTSASPELKIFKQPEMGHRYVLASDVAEGKANGDYSAAHVVDWETNEQVAEVHGHWDPDIFGKKLAVVGWYYNTALIGVERNNHGHSVLNTLINQVGYENLYHHVDYDSANGEERKVPGWPTDPKTRPIMMSDLRTVMREQSMKVNSATLLNELFTFIVNDQGKEEAQSGCHDDLVMALAIAIQLRKYMPALTYATAPRIGGW
ncbi:hypothetical protein SAMN05421743_105209 [Thalassobacillus cyri]|uniref:Phage terminase-like protein, large subunit, contains N-terminal HTH domain n=1 Tax=Thalassobacillus cyri TaxID=571932 RepID=A0A1H4BZM9_9BACI|nr:hypothetical protein SAMN05421743_105209 [Thalassobacillus cyri]